jgi:hypothetical protein
MGSDASKDYQGPEENQNNIFVIDKFNDFKDGYYQSNLYDLYYKYIATFIFIFFIILLIFELISNILYRLPRSYFTRLKKNI